MLLNVLRSNKFKHNFKRERGDIVRGEKNSLKQRALKRALCFIRINLGGFMKKLLNLLY